MLTFQCERFKRYGNRIHFFEFDVPKLIIVGVADGEIRRLEVDSSRSAVRRSIWRDGEHHMPFMPPRDKTVLIIHETWKLVDFLAFQCRSQGHVWNLWKPCNRTGHLPNKRLGPRISKRKRNTLSHQLLNWFQRDELSNDEMPALDWPNISKRLEPQTLPAYQDIP